MGARPTISYERDGRGTPTLRIRGDLDLAAGDVVVEAVRTVLAVRGRASGEAEVQLDLAGVPFIDCAGLSALLRARRLAAAQGWVLLVAATSPAVQRLLALSGTRSLLAAVPQRAPAPPV